MDRRRFIRIASPLTLLLTDGRLLNAANTWYDDESRKKVSLRIAVASDGHFGGSWGKPYKGFRVVEVWKDQTLVSYMLDPLQKLNALKLSYSK